MSRPGCCPVCGEDGLDVNSQEIFDCPHCGMPIIDIDGVWVDLDKFVNQ